MQEYVRREPDAAGPSSRAESLIPILRLSDRRLRNRASDGHDFPRLVDERVPGEATVIDDIVEEFEDAV